MSDLVSIIKEIVVNQNNASSPVAIMRGKVTSTSPLSIWVSPKLQLDEAQVFLTKNTMDYVVDMTVDHITEKRSGGSGDAAYAPHDHDYKGRKGYRVHNGLKVGDTVLLLRFSGGQDYVALDILNNRNDKPITNL